MKTIRLSLLALLWLPAVGWAEVNFYLTRAGTGIDGVTWCQCCCGDFWETDLDLWIDTDSEPLGAFDCDLVASESWVFEVTDRVWQGAFAETSTLVFNNAVSGGIDPVFPNIGAMPNQDLPGTSFPMLVQTISIRVDTTCPGYFTLTLANMLAGNVEGGTVNKLEVGPAPVFHVWVPEPASLMLAVAGGLALLRRWGRPIG